MIEPKFDLKRYGLVLLGITVVLILLRIGLSTLQQDPAKSVESRSSMVPQAEARDSIIRSDTRKRLEARKPVRDTGQKSDSPLAKIAKARTKILDFLSSDEASRSTLLWQKEYENGTEFLFEIKRNADLDEKIGSLYKELALEESVNISALKNSTSPFLSRFKIPDGMSQKLLVRVPNSRDEATHYYLGLSSENEDTTSMSWTNRLSIYGTVSKETPAWDYRRILDLDM